MDNLDYSQQLAEISKDFRKFAFEYKKERALYAQALNTLTNLIYLTGLHDDKSSFENKLTKLLATPQVEAAQKYIEQLNTLRANYKGWEKVLDSYQAQISAIQSVIKYNLTGECITQMEEKYGKKTY